MSQFLSTPSRRLYPCSDPRIEWMQFPLTLSLVRTPQEFLLQQLCLLLLLLFRMHRVHVEHHRAQHVLPCCIFEPLLRINYEWSTLRWVVMVSIHLLFDSLILSRRCFSALILPSLIAVRLQNCYALRILRYCQKNYWDTLGYLFSLTWVPFSMWASNIKKNIILLIEHCDCRCSFWFERRYCNIVCS